MLAVAAAKGAYDRLEEGDLTARLPFEDARFAGVVCAGVFTTGHVGPEGLDELLRVLRPGGVLVLSVKDQTWEGGFAVRVAELEGQGRVARLDATPSYSSMPGRPGNALSRALVLRRL
jgi:ubiquinone/menaquinone biosynthesis C-methylase UbiE